MDEKKLNDIVESIEKCVYTECHGCKYLDYENCDMKLVADLKDLIHHLSGEIVGLKKQLYEANVAATVLSQKNTEKEDRIEQAVKDRTNEILQMIDNHLQQQDQWIINKTMGGSVYKLAIEEIKLLIKKRYGVEIE